MIWIIFLKNIHKFFHIFVTKNINCYVTNAQTPPRCLDETWTSAKYSELIFSNHCVENSSSHKYWWFLTLPFLKTIYCLPWLGKVNKLHTLDLKVCRSSLQLLPREKFLAKLFSSHVSLWFRPKIRFSLRLFGRRRFFFSRDRNRFIKN